MEPVIENVRSVRGLTLLRGRSATPDNFAQYLSSSPITCEKPELSRENVRGCPSASRTRPRFKHRMSLSPTSSSSSSSARCCCCCFCCCCSSRCFSCSICCSCCLSSLVAEAARLLHLQAAASGAWRSGVAAWRSTLLAGGLQPTRSTSPL